MKNNSRWLFTSVLALAVCCSPLARADHRDAIGALDDPRTNIADFYAFRNANTGNVVLAMTVSGGAVPGVTPVFAPGCLYQFKIDNTGDFIEDLVIQFVFDKPVGPAFSPTQGFTLIGPTKPPKAGGSNSLAKPKATAGAGPFFNLTNTIDSSSFTTGNNMRVFCGPRDDPFFFDEIYIRNFLRGTLASPNPPQTRSNIPGIDFYAGLNCSIIAVEVPPALITGVPAQTHLNIWATVNVPTSVARSLKAPARGEPLEIRESTSKAYVQHDRAAIPGVSTFLIAESDKNAFAAGQPKDDVKFFAEAARPLIQELQLNSSLPAAIIAADQVIASHCPNVLNLDVTSNAGYPNGRRPEDDVIDYELNALSAGDLTTDHVNANDVPFFTTFPFFAQRHKPSEGVPRRD